MTTRRGRTLLTGALTLSVALAWAAGMARPVSAEPVPISGATFEWTVNDEANTGAFNGDCNFMGAGESDGSAGTYRATDANATVLKRDATGAFVPISDYATRCLDAEGVKVTPGGTRRLGQKVRYTAGTGTADPVTGAMSIQWTGTFSNNFYGHLIPFWFADPLLTVAADGTGTITATVGGYASSIENPDVRELVTPMPGVVIATLRGVDNRNPDGFVVTPDFAGVVVDSADNPQNRVVAGWGSWPTSFISAMHQLGSAPYWYSTGGSADSRKPAAPIVVGLGEGTAPTTTVGPTTTTAPTTTQAAGPSTTVVPTTVVPTTVVDATPVVVASAGAGGGGTASGGSSSGSSAGASTRRSTSGSTTPTTPRQAFVSGAESASGAGVTTSVQASEDSNGGSTSEFDTESTGDAALEFTDLRVDHRAGWNPAAPGSLRVHYTIENTGTVALRASQTLRVDSRFGPDRRVEVTDTQVLSPGRSYEFSEDIAAVWPGLDTAVSVELEPYAVDGSSGVSVGSVTARTDLRLWPASQLLLTLVGLAAAALVVLAIRSVRSAGPVTSASTTSPMPGAPTPPDTSHVAPPPPVAHPSTGSPT